MNHLHNEFDQLALLTTRIYEYFANSALKDGQSTFYSTSMSFLPHRYFLLRLLLSTDYLKIYIFVQFSFNIPLYSSAFIFQIASVIF